MYVCALPAAWLREQYVAGVFMNDSQLPPATDPYNKAQASVSMSVLDTVGILAYFIYTMGMILLSQRLSAEADTSIVTIHDYSIRVHHLPEDTTAEELVDFFGQYGEVRSIRQQATWHKLALRVGLC